MCACAAKEATAKLLVNNNLNMDRTFAIPFGNKPDGREIRPWRVKFIF